MSISHESMCECWIPRVAHPEGEPASAEPRPWRLTRRHAVGMTCLSFDEGSSGAYDAIVSGMCESFGRLRACFPWCVHRTSREGTNKQSNGTNPDRLTHDKDTATIAIVENHLHEMHAEVSS